MSGSTLYIEKYNKRTDWYDYFLTGLFIYTHIDLLEQLDITVKMNPSKLLTSRMMVN